MKSGVKQTCAKEQADHKLEAVDLLVNRYSYPPLGGDQKNEVMHTSGRNLFSLKGLWVLL